MSNPSKRGGLVPIVLASLLLSTVVLAADESRNPLDAAPPARTTPSSGETMYLVRCWQYGRLLFEERDLQLPADVSAGLKLRGTDRNRQAVYVTDTGNATCLIRSVPPKH
ncbi:MAG: hypothetical protein JF606_13955 [Burkholderiales bacterium]|jgi:hypothetical protein|nr:hypothetical protein [Burkholderiales bacterium]